MNGRYLLDTNAVIALLQGNQRVVQQLQNAEWVGISIISQLEFLAFARLSDTDRQVFEQFRQRVEIIGLDSSQTELIDKIIQIRQQYRLPLPDAIIAGTALEFDSSLVTADQRLHNLQELTVVTFT